MERKDGHPYPLNISQLQSMKEQGKKIVAITASDYTQAVLADQSGVDLILAGESLGPFSLGYKNDRRTSMPEMVAACRSVARGARQAVVVANMPFGSYRVSIEQAMANALDLLSQGGCRGVKLECSRETVEIVKELTRRGVPVLAHIGLLPQTAGLWEGFDTRGCDEDEAWELVDIAQALEEAGAFALLVQGVTTEVARMITAKVDIPTIGMGAGVECDGQLLVFHDVVGLSDQPPSYAKAFVQAGDLMRRGLSDYCSSVREGSYPDEQHSVQMSQDEAKRLY